MAMTKSQDGVGKPVQLKVKNVVKMKSKRDDLHNVVLPSVYVTTHNTFSIKNGPYSCNNNK